MSGLDVAAIVGGIVAAFASGMDIFKNMRQRRAKLRKATKQSSEEGRLQRSLLQRPLQVSAEYHRSFEQLGEGFARGDSIAQAVLTRTLLVMNQSLMSILSSALAADGRSRDASRRSLLHLSETSAADAVHALKQLQQRLKAAMTQLRNPLILTPEDEQGRERKRSNAGADGSFRQAHRKKNRAPQASPRASEDDIHPLSKPRSSSATDLRAAWVRPKRGISRAHLDTGVSSAVPTPRKKETARNNGLKPSHKRRDFPLSSKSSSQLCMPAAADSASTLTRKQAIMKPEEKRRQWISAGPSEPDPVIPILRESATARKPTPSTISFVSDSTKIGEIPEHKWIVPFEPEQMGPFGWPTPRTAEQAGQKSRSRFGALKFWRKKCEEA